MTINRSTTLSNIEPRGSQEFCLNIACYWSNKTESRCWRKQEFAANLNLNCVQVLDLPFRCHMSLYKSLTLFMLQFAICNENKGTYVNTSAVGTKNKCTTKPRGGWASVGAWRTYRSTFLQDSLAWEMAVGALWPLYFWKDNNAMSSWKLDHFVAHCSFATLWQEIVPLDRCSINWFGSWILGKKTSTC